MSVSNVLCQISLLLSVLQQFSLASAEQHAVRNLPLSDGAWARAQLNQYYFEPDYDPGVRFDPHRGRTRKIAIIGAGPTGTSAAYFLKHAQDRLSSNFSSNGDTIETTIYERETRIGGRTAVTYPYDDTNREPIELGASIFADVNLNLRRAVKDFSLETGAHTGLSGQMGIWDGQQFLFEGEQSSWWTSAKFFLRYGYSAITTESIVKKQLAYFSGLYRPSFLHARKRTDEGGSISGYPWETVEQLADAVNASELVATTGMQFFKDRRVSELFIEEMVEAATRVNYAQDTDQIHGFGALVSLAASGATGVKDGNYRIFEEFARRSGAKVRTGIEGHVTGLVRFNSVVPTTSRISLDGKPASQTQWYVGTKNGEGEVYDAVIIATPWHNADITLLNTPSRVKGKPFVHLHVTLLTTSRPYPNPEYFGLGAQDVVPTTILTSSESVRRANEKRKPSDGDQPAEPNPRAEPPHSSKQPIKKPNLEFFSLNYLRSIEPPSSSFAHSDKQKEYVVKIFSSKPVSDELISRLFGLSTVSWIHRHEWDSYPYLTPVVAPTARFPHIEVDENLFYPNAMENLVSTMETSTVAAKNAVGLLLKNWFGHDFVNGNNCSYNVEDELKNPLENGNWAGWGCDSG